MNNALLLDGKVAMISGAASARGIGLATARLFARHGAKVVILDLDEAAAVDAAASIGPEHRGYGCNVVDKDACSELLAREVGADLFIMATDTAAVFLDWGKPTQRGIHRAHPDAMREHEFPAGSMGPKVDAACRFARATGRTAAIGALADIPAIVRGEKGTRIDQRFAGLTYHA